MKKTSFILLLLTIMFISCACSKDVYSINIDKDNNVSLSYIYGTDRDAIPFATGMKANKFLARPEVKEVINDSDKFVAFLNHEYPNALITSDDTKLYDDGKYIGFVQIINNIKPDKFDKKYLPLGFKLMEPDFLTVKEGFLKDKYIIHLEYNDAYSAYKNFKEPASENERLVRSTNKKRTITYNDDNSVVIEEQSDNSDSMDGFNVKSNIGGTIVLPKKPEQKIIIEIPYKAKKHNATAESGKYRYEWDLFSEDYIHDIYLEYEKSNGTLGVICIFISIIVFMLFAGIMYKKSTDDVTL